jgi:hypothetical protein
MGATNSTEYDHIDKIRRVDTELITYADCESSDFDTDTDADLDADLDLDLDDFAPASQTASQTASAAPPAKLQTKFASHCYRSPGPASDSLQLAQSIMVDAYADLQRYGIMQMQNTFLSDDATARSVRAHALHDPLGTLHAALLLVRLMPPMPSRTHTESPTTITTAFVEHAPQLPYGYRLKMAAMLMCVHKFATNLQPTKTGAIVVACVKRFLHPHEQQSLTDAVIIENHARMEHDIVTRQPVFKIVRTNVLSLVEEELYKYVLLRAINSDMEIVLRAAAPFLIFACFLNREHEVFETMASTMPIDAIARGFSIALLACAQAAVPLPCLYCPECGSDERAVVRIAMLNAISERSQPLRNRCEGYALTGDSTRSSEYVRRVLRPDVLAEVLRRFEH